MPDKHTRNHGSMKLFYILVEPAVSGNIGAAARALKTMGQQHLILVNPAPYFNDEAKMLGHGSWDILENAQVYKSFDDVVNNFDFLIGTSAKNRSVKYDYYPVEKAKTILYNKNNSIQKAAIVFGREERGLTNDELQACDIISYVPMAISYPSLNLAQAVMLYAYLFASSPGTFSEENNSTENQELYKIAKSKTSISLDCLGLNENSPIHNRIMERVALLNADDLHLVLSVCNKILDKN